MNYNGYELTSDWRNCNLGKIATATKDGKVFLLKMYLSCVAPLDNGNMSPKRFELAEKKFKDFVNTRKKINDEIKAITGGNIIIPVDEFIYENHYIEVTEFIEGAVKDEDLKEVLASLSIEEKELLLKTIAEALYGVHSKKIVHGDLKLKNVLLVKNDSDKYAAKLIDFDCSYFIGHSPDEIIGTIEYYSPEMGEYALGVNDRDELGEKITEKTDIFSLGLIIHQCLCGCFPRPVSLKEELVKRQEEGKLIHCWVALNTGGELQLDPGIKSKKFISLITEMLSLNPDDRPSAEVVLKRLNEK